MPARAGLPWFAAERGGIMRTSTVGILAAAVGVIMTIWALLAAAGAVARGTGGNYGPSPVSDFAIEHFFFLGPLAFVFGLLLWLGTRAPKAGKGVALRAHDVDGPPP
jgi:hypothetical protein